MNVKSISPRSKPQSKSNKTILAKLSPPKQITPIKLSDSSTHFSPYNSQSNLSSSRLNLKVKPFPKKAFVISAANQIKQIKRCFSPPAKSVLSPKKATESVLPQSAKNAVSSFSGVLSKYELREMNEYENIYYVGLKASKIIPDQNLKNYGFDDATSNYSIVKGDHIAYQYEVLETLGSGSFAQVVKCLDHRHKREVAIKVIKSHKRFQPQAQIELKILIFLKSEAEKKSFSNFVDIISYFTFRKHICIVFELLSFSLYDLLKANSFNGFSATLVKRFVVQVLQALSFLRQNQIIHCDLKPENIVLVSPHESAVKVIDFGSSCFESEKVYYYIQSRIYRAPEIILGVPYTAAIDMWSLGCIITELVTGTPLFEGESEEDQLNAIIEVFGFPPFELIENGLKAKKFFGPRGKLKNAATPTGRVRLPESKRIEDLVPTKDMLFYDFIKGKR
jgi:dual specificity tyrosine-phosphorylation-regulated kinase 2/3/4